MLATRARPSATVQNPRGLETRTTKKNTKDPISSRNPLTREQTAVVAGSLVRSLDGFEGDIGDLILLCHALTFEPDMTVREGMLMAIEKQAGPLLTAVDDALNSVKRRQYEALKGGVK